MAMTAVMPDVEGLLSEFGITPKSLKAFKRDTTYDLEIHGLPGGIVGSAYRTDFLFQVEIGLRPWTGRSEENAQGRSHLAERDRLQERDAPTC